MTMAWEVSSRERHLHHPCNLHKISKEALVGSPSGVSEWGLRAGDLAPALMLRGWRLARASRPRHLSSAGVAVLLTPPGGLTKQ